MARKWKRALRSRLEPIEYDPRIPEHHSRIENLDERVRRLENRIHGLFIAGGIIGGLLLLAVAILGLPGKLPFLSPPTQSNPDTAAASPPTPAPP